MCYFKITKKLYIGKQKIISKILIFWANHFIIFKVKKNICEFDGIKGSQRVSSTWSWWLQNCEKGFNRSITMSLSKWKLIVCLLWNHEEGKDHIIIDWKDKWGVNFVTFWKGDFAASIVAVKWWWFSELLFYKIMKREITSLEVLFTQLVCWLWDCKMLIQAVFTCSQRLKGKDFWQSGKGRSHHRRFYAGS